MTNFDFQLHEEEIDLVNKTPKGTEMFYCSPKGTFDDDKYVEDSPMHSGKNITA